MGDDPILDAVATKVTSNYSPVPIDLVFAAVGIRARHIPGEVDFSTRQVVGPDRIAPGRDLRLAINTVIGGDSSPLVALKIDRVAGESHHCRCGGQALPVKADLALGQNLGLVVETLSSHFCFEDGLLTLDDNGASLRERLSWWTQSIGPADYIEPSLRYETETHPRAVQLEITTRCNLACAYCSQSAITAPADITWDNFVRTIDLIDFEETDIVDFTGLGEPTLHRELPRMVAEVTRRGPHLSIRVVSNGVAASPAHWEHLVEAGLTSIAFSIDTLDPSRFTRQRGGAVLTKALRSAKHLASLRRNSGMSFALRIKAVLIEDERPTAEGLMRWSIQEGLDMPQFSSLDRRQLAKRIYADTPWLAVELENPEMADDFQQWASQFWREHGGLDAPTAPLRLQRYRHPRIAATPHPCRWVTNATFVTGGADILTCCESMIDIPRQVVGAIRHRPLGEEWRDELLWTYRLPLTLGRLPPGCVGCPHTRHFDTPAIAT